MVEAPPRMALVVMLVVGLFAGCVFTPDLAVRAAPDPVKRCIRSPLSGLWACHRIKRYAQHQATGPQVAAHDTRR